MNLLDSLARLGFWNFRRISVALNARPDTFTGREGAAKKRADNEV